MHEEQLHAIMSSQVAVSCADLAPDEWAALSLAVQLDMDARGRAGYEKVRHLFTEAGGTRMHDETKRAFLNLAYRQLSV
jgi:hypothetical protein